jgi:hypothetical protein
MTNLRALKIRLASLKINNNTMIEMSDAKTGKVEATDTLKSFYDVNEEDEEVIEALDILKSGKKTEVKVSTGQGYFILRILK